MFFSLFLMVTWITAQATASLLRPNSARLSDHSLTEIINRNIIKPARENDDLPTATKRYFELPLNHGDPKSPKFRNSYWVDDTYYSPGGPIFCMWEAGCQLDIVDANIF